MINQQLYPAATKGSHRTSFAGHFCCISDSELSTSFDLGVSLCGRRYLPILQIRGLTMEAGKLLGSKRWP